jgi:EmrB/QacA subfamily drug resistance transporter
MSTTEFILKSISATLSSADIGDAMGARRVRWALVSLSLSMLLSSLGTSIANVSLPTLAQAFSASFQAVQWVVLAYLLAITSVIVSMGRLGDLMGRRRLLLVGIFIFTVASVLCSLAPTLWLLIIARAAQGIGAAIMMALAIALIAETVPKAKTGSAMGLIGTMSAIGTALGPSLGGVLIAGLGWRSIFFINLPLGLITFFLAYRYLPVDRKPIETERIRFDHLGTLLLGLTLVAYALAMTVGQGRFGALNIALLLATGIGISLFVWVESRTVSPLIHFATLRNPVLSASLVMNALVSTVMMATLVVGPFYLAFSLGLDAVFVGLIMSIGPIISALCGLIAGRMVDRMGARFVAIAGLVLMFAGSLALSTLAVMYGVAGYIAAIAILTPGYQLFQAANNTAVMVDAPASERGVISGLLSLSRNLGLITGAAVMGAVFAIASAGSAGAGNIPSSPAAVATGMQTTFIVAAILTSTALVIALRAYQLASRNLPRTPHKAS